jgi:hypothetical protein
MNVLIACEESQVECIAFREMGHAAFSCDLQDCSGGHPEWHIKGDVLDVIDGDCTFRTCDTHMHTQRGPWDLIIAHPPCTYLSNAGACRLYPKAGQLDEERLKKGIQAKDFFMRFWYARCDKIAIENPVPSAVFCMPPTSQIIQPYEFGEDYSKKTCLWLKGLPPLMATFIVPDFKPYVSCGTSKNKGNPDKAGVSRAGGAAKVRSRSFQNIARAMAAQWG